MTTHKHKWNIIVSDTTINSVKSCYNCNYLQFKGRLGNNETCGLTNCIGVIHTEIPTKIYKANCDCGKTKYKYENDKRWTYNK